MLALMRSKVGNYIAKSLMVLLIMAFAVWGVGDIARGNFGTVVARVGDAQISLAELDRQSRLFARAAQAAGLKDIDPRLLHHQMLRRLIEEKLTQQILDDIGLRVGDAQLARELRQAPALLKLDGTFDPARFAAMLRERQVSESAFLAQLKSDIENKTLIQSIYPDAITLPPPYRAAVARAHNQTRDVALVTIRPDSITPEIPTDAEISDYYELQKNNLYLTPETRTLEYATFSAADIAKNSSAAGDRAIEEMTFAIEDALAAGESLKNALSAATIAATPRTLTSITPNSGRDTLTRAIIAEGFALSEGETSGLKLAEGGVYYIVHVASVTKAAPKPLALVRGDIIQRLKEESQRDAVTLKAQAIAMALKKQPDWRAVLAAEKLGSQPIRAVTRNGKDSLAAALREAIFEHPVGGIAGPMSVANGGAQLAIITAIHPGKADTLTAEATKKLQADWEQEIFAQYFNTLATRYPVRIDEKVFARLSQNAATP